MIDTKGNRRWWYLLMASVSTFFATDYMSLILSGDDTMRRKVVLGVWIIAAIAWFIAFFRTKRAPLVAEEFSSDG